MTVLEVIEKLKKLPQTSRVYMLHYDRVSDIETIYYSQQGYVILDDRQMVKINNKMMPKIDLILGCPLCGWNPDTDKDNKNLIKKSEPEHNFEEHCDYWTETWSCPNCGHVFEIDLVSN